MPKYIIDFTLPHAIFVSCVLLIYCIKKVYKWKYTNEAIQIMVTKKKNGDKNIEYYFLNLSKSIRIFSLQVQNWLFLVSKYIRD